MNDSHSRHGPSPRRLAVIGGGITGLAAAHRLTELEAAATVTLFEAGGRAGGILRTEEHDGYLLEHSADSFISSADWAVDLCRRIGFADQLMPTNAAWRRAFIVRDGRLHAVPDGFSLLAASRLWPLLTTRLLSLAGKLRLVLEPFVPVRQSQSDESLAAFARRRLGREAFERLVQPLVAGIYTADAEQLSMAAALPRFVEMERRHGSLLRGARLAAAGYDGGRGTPGEDNGDAGARYGLFLAPRRGMESLVEALAGRLPSGTIETGSEVEAIERREGGGWLVRLAGRLEPRQFDGLVIALPAHSAAGLLSAVDASLAGDLDSIPHAGSIVALAGYDRSDIAHPLDGFGFVVPEIEGRRILAASFASVKFAQRAPQGKVLLRVFLGGAQRPEMIELDDGEVRRVVVEELAELLGARGGPELFRVCRWRGSMPQYHLGHLEVVARIESRAGALSQLELAGNAYYGVGVPHCIHSGEQAAQRLVAEGIGGRGEGGKGG